MERRPYAGDAGRVDTVGVWPPLGGWLRLNFPDVPRESASHERSSSGRARGTRRGPRLTLEPPRGSPCSARDCRNAALNIPVWGKNAIVQWERRSLYINHVSALPAAARKGQVGRWCVTYRLVLELYRQ